MKLKVKHYDNAEILNLMNEIELPIIDVIVDMKLIGINVDLEYAQNMSTEYHKKLDAINDEILEEYNENLKPLVDNWRLSPEANAKKRVYPAKKTKMSEVDILKKFPKIDEKGQHYKMSSKTPNEQLSEPVDFASPTQLQILLYDIMKVPVVDHSDPRGTGADILKELSERNIKICQLLMKMREVDILINNFIDKMPQFVQQKTGKLHCSFKSIGADTGRFSSEDPSLQQIPAHDKSIRMMFKAGSDNHLVELENNYYVVKYTDDVEIDTDVWRRIKDIGVGDKILNSDNTYDIIRDIKYIDNYYYLYV